MKDLKAEPWGISCRIPRGGGDVLVKVTESDDAHRDGKPFIVRADEKLTEFVELEAAICAGGDS
jgi:hypothetical protein